MFSWESSEVCWPKIPRSPYNICIRSTRDGARRFPFLARAESCAGVVIEATEVSGSLITARLAMEFGREVFGVPGNVTPAASYAPNMLIKLGAKLVVNAEDVIEGLPTPVRAALVKAERPEAEQSNLLAFAALGASKKKLYQFLVVEEIRPIDELVEK